MGVQCALGWRALVCSGGLDMGWISDTKRLCPGIKLKGLSEYVLQIPQGLTTTWTLSHQCSPLLRRSHWLRKVLQQRHISTEVSPASAETMWVHREVFVRKLGSQGNSDFCQVKQSRVNTDICAVEKGVGETWIRKKIYVESPVNHSSVQFQLSCVCHTLPYTLYLSF